MRLERNEMEEGGIAEWRDHNYGNGNGTANQTLLGYTGWPIIVGHDWGETNLLKVPPLQLSMKKYRGIYMGCVASHSKEALHFYDFY